MGKKNFSPARLESFTVSSYTKKGVRAGLSEKDAVKNGIRAGKITRRAAEKKVRKRLSNVRGGNKKR